MRSTIMQKLSITSPYRLKRPKRSEIVKRILIKANRKLALIMSHRRQIMPTAFPATNSLYSRINDSIRNKVVVAVMY